MPLEREMVWFGNQDQPTQIRALPHKSSGTSQRLGLMLFEIPFFFFSKGHNGDGNEI